MSSSCIWETGMALKEIIVETQANLRLDPSSATAVFSVIPGKWRTSAVRPGFASSP
jgi:hypothetical protein